MILKGRITALCKINVVPNPGGGILDLKPKIASYFPSRSVFQLAKPIIPESIKNHTWMLPVTLFERKAVIPIWKLLYRNSCQMRISSIDISPWAILSGLHLLFIDGHLRLYIDADFW